MQKFQIMVLGAGGVGKSALTMRFVRDVFVDTYNPTIEENYVRQLTVDGIDSRLDVMDTAGAEQFSSMNDLYFRSGHGFVLVFSLTTQSTIREVEMLKEQISREKPDAPIIVVANKLDLVQERQVSSQAVRDLAAKWNLPVYETSAKRNWQVANVFEELVRRIRVQYPMDEAVAKRRRRRKRDMCTVM